MTDEQLLRYSRHLLLEELGIEAQEHFARARVLVLGAGGLGNPAAAYLALAGVGRLAIVDNDAVEASNLQRQWLHAAGRLGMNKAVSAAQSLADLNPDLVLETYPERVDAPRLVQLLHGVDVLVDASDNRATRDAANRAALETGVPLVSGAASRFAGHVAVFNRREADCPCYECLYPAEQAPADDACAVLGIFAPVTGVIGAWMAAEALRLLHPFGTAQSGALWMFDGLGAQARRLRFERRADCSVCASAAQPAAAPDPGAEAAMPAAVSPDARRGPR